MNKTLLRSLLLGACAVAPFAAIAGGVEVAPCCNPPRVDIPDMREGWGFYLEGAAIRPYNNNTVFGDTLTFVAPNFDFFEVDYDAVNPDFNFALRVGVDYTMADSANILKLEYEHVWDSQSTANSDASFVFFDDDEDDIPFVSAGDVKIRLDAVKLVSEQHILIGPYWEATLTGGLRYARVQQKLNYGTALDLFVDGEDDDDGFDGALAFDAFENTMTFNGVGPLGGVGGMFHVTENLAFGAETQIALLLGSNKLDIDYYALLPNFFEGPDFIPVAGEFNTSSQTSIVPEIFARIYGNYFYRFDDGMELQVELGWRLDQYFNLRTSFAENELTEDAFFAEAPITISDEIGFSGPYLAAHLKI